MGEKQITGDESEVAADRMDKSSRPSTHSRPLPVAPEINLDWVLINELGQFGRFQLTNLLLVSVPIIMSAFMSEFIFSAAAVPHRCRIPECGESAKGSYAYEREWILNAVPAASGGGPASCERYVPAGGGGSASSCPASLFHQNSTQACDGYVYERTNSVVYDFDLGCQEWLRVLAGTMSAVGTLLQHQVPVPTPVRDHSTLQPAQKIPVPDGFRLFNSLFEF